MSDLNEYRARLLDRMERLPAQFAAVIAAMPEAEWWLRCAPGSGGGHTVHNLMAHVRDVETLAYLPRLRRILAEDEPTMPSFGSHRWSQADYDATEPMEALLSDYARAREEEVALLRDLPVEGWSRCGFHPPTGRRTAQWWMERALAHGLEHLADMRAARIP